MCSTAFPKLNMKSGFVLNVEVYVMLQFSVVAVLVSYGGVVYMYILPSWLHTTNCEDWAVSSGGENFTWDTCSGSSGGGV